MVWQAAPGATLLVPSGEKKHLHVVVLGPVPVQGYGNANQIALVSITTKYPGVPFDSACEVAAGEHDFIRHDSWVAYKYLRIDSEAHAHARIADHIWIEHIACSEALLQRIRAGVCVSRFTSGEFRRMFGC